MRDKYQRLFAVEPLANVVERQAIADALVAGRGLRCDGIADDDLDLTGDDASRDRHGPAVLERFDAVVDRVLEQRLHGESRHERPHRQLRDIPLHVEPVAEP